MDGAYAGLRPSLLRQVVPKRAVLDAGGLPVRQRRIVHRHAVRPCLWSVHTTPHARGCMRRREHSRLCRWCWPCPRQDTSRCSRHAGMPRSAKSPFGSGRPLRPWLVVNPGEGTATPWASWLQPSSENNFPCAARIPRGTNYFRFQVLHAVALAARCSQPIPRRPVHNKDAMARPCSTRKEKHHG